MHISVGVHPLPNDPGTPIQHLVSFTPGRVNLIGEHTDYNGGIVMPAALHLGLQSHLSVLSGSADGVFVASRNMNSTLHMTGEDISKIASQLIITGIERSDAIAVEGLNEHRWASYIIGCFALFEASLKVRQHHTLPWQNHCLSIILDSNLPQGAGLSSSAALCISILGQLNVLSGVPLDAATLARLAMFVEHRFAGTHCGLMDQLAVLCSRVDHFTRIDFLEFPVSHSFHISYAKAHETYRNYMLLIFKTGVSHTLAESAYNERRASCEAALQGLNKRLGLGAHSLGELGRLPRFQSISTENDYLAQLTELLSEQRNHIILAKRACHAMLENSRVMTASRALATGDLQSLRNSLRASHASLDSLYEVTCPELNAACLAVEKTVSELCVQRNVSADDVLIGPRMTGGGFGGSTVQLVHRTLIDDLLEKFSQSKNHYTQITGIQPELIVSQPSAGFSSGLETIE